MSRIRLLGAGALLIAVAGCGFNLQQQRVQGSGKVVTEPRTVSGFSEVALKGTGHLTIDQGGTESLTITADDNLLPYLTSEVSGNKLVIGTRDNMQLAPTKDIEYKLGVKGLSVIDFGGEGSVDARGLQSDRMKITLGGSGNIKAAGTVEQQEVTLAGSGNYQGNDLKSKIATINIVGSGDAELNASDKLNVSIVGSGSVRYTGEPMVTQQILGSGSIQKR